MSQPNHPTLVYVYRILSYAGWVAFMVGFFVELFTEIDVTGLLLTAAFMMLVSSDARLKIAEDRTRE